MDCTWCKHNRGLPWQLSIALHHPYAKEMMNQKRPRTWPQILLSQNRPGRIKRVVNSGWVPYTCPAYPFCPVLFDFMRGVDQVGIDWSEELVNPGQIKGDHYDEAIEHPKFVEAAFGEGQDLVPRGYKDFFWFHGFEGCFFNFVINFKM